MEVKQYEYKMKILKGVLEPRKKVTVPKQRRIEEWYLK